MNEQTSTPRTDEKRFEAVMGRFPDGSLATESAVDSDFARNLERELAEKDAQIATLESKQENWRVSSVARELRAELDAAQAQIVAMRKQCVLLRSMLADERVHAQHVVDGLSAISHAKPEQRNELWHKLVHVCRGRMIWPDKIPPPVVPLEEARALADALEALRDEQNGPPLERHKEDWQKAYDTANQLIATFNAKHPID